MISFVAFLVLTCLVACAIGRRDSKRSKVELSHQGNVLISVEDNKSFDSMPEREVSADGDKHVAQNGIALMQPAESGPPIFEVTDLFSDTFDRMGLAGWKIDGCQPFFFPATTVLMYRYLKYPGQCDLGSCESRKASVEGEEMQYDNQDCGSKSICTHPWYKSTGCPARYREVNWEKMICGDEATLRALLPPISECGLEKLVSVQSIRICLQSAVAAGHLPYVFPEEEVDPFNMAYFAQLHSHVKGVIHMAWNRDIDNILDDRLTSRTPPDNSPVVGFSFGKDSCKYLRDCKRPGMTNELLAEAAVAYAEKQRSGVLILQYEIAVAAANKIVCGATSDRPPANRTTQECIENLAASASASLTNQSSTSVWVDVRMESVRKLSHASIQIYALGGITDYYLPTNEVLMLAGPIVRDNPLIALAHPDHLPRVWRNIVKVAPNSVDRIYPCIMPLRQNWWTWEPGPAHYPGFNIFTFTSDPSLWEGHLRIDEGRGMYTDSNQPWTKYQQVFLLYEFFGYIMQAKPGRDNLGNVARDKNKIPPCEMEATIQARKEAEARIAAERQERLSAA